MIDSYEFGKICVNGKVYKEDIIIFSAKGGSASGRPDYVKSNWWRKDGHHLCIEDIEDVISAKPDVLIIGTGTYGRMYVPADVKEYIEQQGIEVIVEHTEQAVALFNRRSKAEKAVAALHLTC